MRFFLLLFLSASVLVSSACHPKPSIMPKSVNEDFAEIFAQYGIAQENGSFLMWRKSDGFFRTYNEKRNQTSFIPASTFKIPNTLIGLETGVIQDENTMFKWDGTKRSIASWNQDTNLKMAFQNSTVWYYQELARRVGATKMQQWLDKLEYGNRNMSGGIDLFWLTGDLRISPYEQIAFLKKIVARELPVTPKSLDTLKRIMVREQTAHYVLYAKTGMATGVGGMDIGWFVGYVEHGNDITYFALNMAASSPATADFIPARIDITKAILKQMNVIP